MEQFEIAAITVAELWHGVEPATGPNRIRRLRYLNGILESLPIIPYTEQTAREHARIWAELEASGKRIGFYDLIVGATARARQPGGHIQHPPLCSNKRAQGHRTKVGLAALTSPSETFRVQKIFFRLEKASNNGKIG